MSESEFPKDEVWSINGVIMKKLPTIKYSVINNNSISIDGSRGNNIKEKREKEREGARGKEKRTGVERGKERKGQ